VEFPAVKGADESPTGAGQYSEAWNKLLAQLKPSPHLFTNL
jgi:hypothetical protein